jgi:predicted permease
MTIVPNLRYAFRQLKKSPGLSLTVIGTLALGLGATAAMFTIVDRVMLRPLPYQNAQQLVKIKETGQRGPRNGAPFLDLQQWIVRSHTLDQIAFYTPDNHVAFLQGKTTSVQVVAPAISANLFPLLGVQPVMGRNFTTDSNRMSVRPEDKGSIIISDTVWRNVYGADRNILGKTLSLDGQPYMVIGVMPRGFTFPFGGAKPVIWRAVVLGKNDAVRIKHTTPWYAAIGRLNAHATVASAQTELRGIQSEISKLYTDPYEREEISSIQVQSYADSLLGADLRKLLAILLGASALLWLIACVNVTSLLLARSTARQREIALCGALGAGRGRLAAQFLTEGLVLSALAALLGLVIAKLTVTFFRHALITQFNIHTDLTPNAIVVLALAGLTLLTALTSSLLPTIAAVRASIQPFLNQQGSQAETAKNKHRTRSLLVVSEIAMSLTLLVGCGLLLRTIYHLRHVPLGFRTDHVIVANMTIPSYKFAGKDIRTELYQPLLERVQHLPGVESAALMTEVPLGKTFPMIFTFTAQGNSAADIRQRNLTAQFRAVSPEMQQVFRFRMSAGRFFNENDSASSQPVLVVNHAFIKAFYGDDEDPAKVLGQQLFSYTKNRPAIVVGVLDDQHQVSVAEQSQPEIEVCIPQITPTSFFYQSAEGLKMDLAVRTQRNSAAVIPELRRLMQEASPELATSNFTTMDQIVEDSYGSQQFAARILEVFAGCALLLCVAGIYGLLSYLVAQRTRELGLRIALGAERRDVMWLVFRQATWMLLAGLGIGLTLAYFSAVLLRTLLYGVQPQDPWIMASVSTLLIASGLAACALPARRAAKVDPIVALRYE